MADIQDFIYEYISTAQPELEKLAGERDCFKDSLNSKLTSMVKAGSLSNEDAAIIYKQAMQNPANVLNYLDVPTYHHRIGTIAKEATTSTMDPFAEFALS